MCKILNAFQKIHIEELGGQWKLPALTNTDLVGTVAGLYYWTL